MSQNPLSLTQYPQSPVNRRRNNTSLGNRVTLSPKLSIDDSHSLVINTFAKLNTIVAFLDTLIQNRLNAQEAQMINIMKSQIQKMQTDIDGIVEKYNQMIRNKDRDIVLYETRNQLQFYKTQGLRLYGQTQALREQVKNLKAEIRQKKYQLQNASMTIQNLTKKHYKLKLKTLENQSFSKQKSKDQKHQSKEEKYNEKSKEKSQYFKDHFKQEAIKESGKTPASTHFLDYKSGHTSNYLLQNKIKRIKRACSIHRYDLTLQNRSFYTKEKSKVLNKKTKTGRITIKQV